MFSDTICRMAVSSSAAVSVAPRPAFSILAIAARTVSK